MKLMTFNQFRLRQRAADYLRSYLNERRAIGRNHDAECGGVYPGHAILDKWENSRLTCRVDRFLTFCKNAKVTTKIEFRLTH